MVIHMERSRRAKSSAGARYHSSAWRDSAALAALIAAGIVPGVAVAQTSSSPVVLQEVVVTGDGTDSGDGAFPGYVARRASSATKTNTPLIETPQAVTVVGRQQMDDQHVVTLTDALRYVPGVSTASFGADSRNDWFRIRGYSAQETGIYLDGMQLYASPNAFATWKLEPWGLERIDILRGPSAVLYGGGNPGGLVNAVSKKPPMTFQGKLETGINEFGNGYGAVDVGGPVQGTDNLYYRLNMLGRLGGTQVDDVDNDRFFIAPSLTWKPTDATDITISGSYQHDKTEIQNFLPYYGTVKSASFGRIPTDLNTSNPGYGTFMRNQAMVGVNIEHRFNDAWTFRQAARYAYLDVKQLGLYGGGWVTPGGPILNRGNFLTRPTANTFTSDTQLEWKGQTGFLDHKVIVGADYKYYRLQDESIYVAGPTLDVTNPVYTPVAPPTGPYEKANTRMNQIGLYLQDQIKYERFTLVLGGRYDFVDINRKDLIGATSGSKDKGRASGKAGLIYNFDNGIAPFISYSTTFNPLIGYNGTTNEMLLPETGQSIEGGVKFQPPGTNMNYSLTVFNTTRQNVAATLYDFPNPNITTQTGEVRSRGVELEMQAEIYRGLTVIGAYTFADVENTKSIIPAQVGNIPVGVSRSYGSLGANYKFLDGSLQGLALDAGVRINGPSYADDANTLKVPTYAVADLGISYEWKNWKASLFVTNIFDKKYVASCASDVACYYGDRRTASASLSYKW